MTGRRTGAVAAFLGLALGACSSSGESEQQPESAPENDAAATTTLPEDAERLVGRYGHFDVVSYTGESLNTLIISYGLSDLEIRDGEMWTRQQFCHAEQSSDQPITSTVSDAATQAIIPPDTQVTLTTDSDGRIAIQRPATPTAIGIQLDDPFNDPLPTDPNDPRISDDDNDGNPGVTVTIEGEEFSGELYIARREIFAYDLLEQPDGGFAGTVTDHSEQLLIDASNPALLASGDWEQNTDLSQSPIVWTPVDENMTCDELTAQRLDLFGPPPSLAE